MQSKEDYYSYIFNRLIVIFPEQPWKKAINNLNKNPKSTVKQFTDYLISYGIELWGNKNHQEYDSYLNSIIADSIFYCGKILELFDLLEEKQRNRLKHRFSAAFRQPNDMRALIFETFVFFALRHYGYTIECKDDDGIDETYDYMIRKNQKSVQIECKSFAYDKGLIITGDEAQGIMDSILNMDGGFNINENPTGEISLLTVEIFSPIPSSPTDKSKFISAILQEIQEKRYTSTEKFKFHLQKHSNLKNMNEIDAFLDLLPINQHGFDLGLSVTPPNSNKSRCGVQITTHVTNGFWREFEKICKDAAKRQLKKNRPASIMIHIYNTQTIDIILKDERFHKKLNNIFSQDHIISLIVVSNIHSNSQETYPFFYTSPFIKEFKNEKSKFYREISNIIQ